MGEIFCEWNGLYEKLSRFPEVEGPRSPMVRFINWYIGKLHTAAHHDEQASVAFLKVINMVAPSSSILNPRIVWRVIKGNWSLGGRKLLEEPVLTDLSIDASKKRVG
jgi:hypothetical protein